MSHDRTWHGSQVKFAAIGVASSGNNALGIAVSGASLVPISVVLTANEPVGVRMLTATKNILGTANAALSLPGPGGFRHDAEDYGFGETAVGEDIVINLSAAAQVGGGMTYAVCRQDRNTLGP